MKIEYLRSKKKNCCHSDPSPPNPPPFLVVFCLLLVQNTAHGVKFALFLIKFWTLSVRRRGCTPVSVSCATVLPWQTDWNICKTGFSEFRHSTVKLFDWIFCDRLACHCEDSNKESEIPFCQHDVFFRVARSSSSFPLFPSGQHPDEKNHQVKNGHGRDAGCIDYHDCWSEWNCLKYLPYHEQIVRSFTRFLAAQTS